MLPSERKSRRQKPHITRFRNSYFPTSKILKLTRISLILSCNGTLFLTSNWLFFAQLCFAQISWLIVFLLTVLLNVCNWYILVMCCLRLCAYDAAVSIIFIVPVPHCNFAWQTQLEMLPFNPKYYSKARHISPMGFFCQHKPFSGNHNNHQGHNYQKSS